MTQERSPGLSTLSRGARDQRTIPYGHPLTEHRYAPRKTPEQIVGERGMTVLDLEGMSIRELEEMGGQLNLPLLGLSNRDEEDLRNSRSMRARVAIDTHFALPGSYGGSMEEQTMLLNTYRRELWIEAPGVEVYAGTLADHVEAICRLGDYTGGDLAVTTTTAPGSNGNRMAIGDYHPNRGYDVAMVSSYGQNNVGIFPFVVLS